MSKVLVVEDEQVTALDLKLTLEDLDYTVVATHSSGEAALDFLARQRVDLVMMDIHLDGEMLGTEAAAIIRRRWGTPVVFLTAYSDTDTIDDASDTLPYGYLVKPFERHEIDAAVRVALARSQADVRLRDSEERLRLALEAARMNIWEWQPDEHSELMARAHPELNEPQILPIDFEQLLNRVHPEDREPLKQQLAQGDKLHAIVAMQDNGAWCYHELYASVYQRPQQSPRVVGVYRNIDEQYRAQEKLRQADVVFRNASEAIAILDERRRLVSANPAFESITGFRLAQVRGQVIDDFLLHEPQGEDFYRQLHQQTRRHSGEVRCRRGDGSEFPAWQHICVIAEGDHIRHYVMSFSDISVLKDTELKLARLAYRDPLTGVCNRTGIEKALTSLAQQCPDAGCQTAIFYLDIDGFKRINDRLGYQLGDQLLRDVAQRLKTCIGDQDHIGRIGGDEYLLIVHDLDGAAAAHGKAVELLKALEPPFELSKHSQDVSVCIGVAQCDRTPLQSDSLWRAAALALQQAKHNGTGEICLYDFRLALDNLHQQRLEERLAGAIAEQELSVELQPLMNDQQQLVGAEVLCRWYSTELGIVPPDRFIPVAEKTGDIHALGSWVLRRALSILQHWQQSWPQLYLAVNVSPRQLSDQRFPGLVAAVLEEFGVAADRLELELTESVVIDDVTTLPVLERLRALGVGLSIDDFGTGYSSLSRLKNLPITRVKIDRSFVSELPDSSSDLEICRAIIALCRVLEVPVTAEGIESCEQAQLLTAMGCSCLQGYHFSRPLTLERFTQWAAAQQNK
ncbi:GGDEF domain-containing protein [Bacterioplanes sanyensis]|uniref:two-component system response regulator n=1 Tax=Bacterioplanes sanyensis TaxID=1249553 RepID=UPI001672DDA5|nr:EAL domain-containing protein [Bacterioplanes sanyensis]GGY42788.1 GGDEF domain-containing protein [Bacterioplanes sanyensis]